MRNKAILPLTSDEQNAHQRLTQKNYVPVIAGLCRMALGSLNNPNITFGIDQGVETELASLCWAIHGSVEYSEITILSKNKKSEDQRYRSEGMEVRSTFKHNSLQEIMESLSALKDQKSILISFEDLKQSSVSFLMNVYPEVGEAFVKLTGAYAPNLQAHLYVSIPLSLELAQSIENLPKSKAIQYQYLCSKFLEMECTGQIQGRDNREDQNFLAAWDNLMLMFYQECSCIKFYESVPAEYRKGEKE